MANIVEPVGTLEPIDENDLELREMLRLESDEKHQDSLIRSLAAAARAKIEAHIRQRIIQRQVSMTVDGFPTGPLAVPIAPIVSIDEITYTDAGGATQTLSAAAYQLRSAILPNEIWPAYGMTWPVIRCEPDSVQVTLTVGFAENKRAVPADILHAIRLMVAHLNTYRDVAFDGEMAGELPKYVAVMVDHHRLWL